MRLPLKPPEFVDTICSPSAVSPIITSLVVPAGTVKSDPAIRPPDICPPCAPTRQKSLGRQMRNAPRHSADRLHVSWTAATPLVTVAVSLPREMQFCGGQSRHPLGAHG